MAAWPMARTPRGGRGFAPMRGFSFSCAGRPGSTPSRTAVGMLDQEHLLRHQGAGVTARQEAREAHVAHSKGAGDLECYASPPLTLDGCH